MILILNCGSQSIKWKLFDSSLKSVKEGGVRVEKSENYKKMLVGELESIKENPEIVGHRVVHSGGKFSSPLVIDKQNLKELKKLNSLAPLHNPFNILGIELSQKTFAKARQVAVFDTSFYFGLEEKVFTYAIPEKFGIRKFGFHGISHEYVAQEAAKIIARPLEELKLITCHLGGGSSITAINKGKAIDTSMGFTPMEGLVMMTRCGNIDPGVILALGAKIKNKELDRILNNESGLKALCGESDMLKILEKAEGPEEQARRRAKLALDIFVYSIQKYIGAYYAILGGCDALVFTGSIGSGSKKIVDEICQPLDILKNTKILQIQTDEELAIARKIKQKSKILI